ncbi:MAG: NAD(P)H-hydrate dehydratase [Deltaproteobacteria bacterium]|nr:NAD(P)H-hydrate dehydratase [Deltaproteobacteria bacterium]
MKVVTADEMREIDRRAIEEFGIPGVVLMENAGRGAAEIIAEITHETDAGRVLVIAGKGNNGGDGHVVARHLVNRGIDCEILLVGKIKDVKGDARINLDTAIKMGIEIREETGDISVVENVITGAHLVVDGLLGTGLAKEVSGFYEQVIEAINSSDLPVVSLDIPSGLDSTTGRPLGLAVEADVTVTFCLPKTGAVIYPGADYVGQLEVADIGVPYALLEDREKKTSLILKADVEEILLPREADSHKGSYGHLLVVAGSGGKSGAAVMAGKSALRSGAGLVTVAAPSSINSILETNLTEVMTESLSDVDGGFLGSGAVKKALYLLKDKSALVLGPGLSREEESGTFVRAIMEKLSIPAVLDADALWHLSAHTGLISKCKAPLILTPHPGEMATILGISSKEVQQDRLNIARSFAADFECYLILKGARTLVASPEGDVFINMTGNAGMATAGTGDVLCGIVGSLLGQGYSALESALAGVYIHGEAGDRIAEEKGEAGLIATDIIERFPEVFREMGRY